MKNLNLRVLGFLGLLLLGAGILSPIASASSPNIIIKARGGRGVISNNKEAGGCVTPTCKLVLNQGSQLTLKATPAHGYVFRHWLGPCLSTPAQNCVIKGSKGPEHFIAVFGIRIISALGGGGVITLEMRRTGPQTVLVQTISMSNVPAVCDGIGDNGIFSYSTVLSASMVANWHDSYSEPFSGSFSVGDPILGGQMSILSGVKNHRIGGTADITVAPDANTNCDAGNLGWDAYLPR